MPGPAILTIPNQTMKLHKLVWAATVSTVALAFSVSRKYLWCQRRHPFRRVSSQFSSYNLGNTNSSLILYNADHTYFQINSFHPGRFVIGGLSPTDTTPGQGTFTYTVDPQNPSHATIIHSGTGNLGPQQLYFASANGGSQTPPFVVDRRELV